MKIYIYTQLYGFNDSLVYSLIDKELTIEIDLTYVRKDKEKSENDTRSCRPSDTRQDHKVQNNWVKCFAVN